MYLSDLSLYLCDVFHTQTRNHRFSNHLKHRSQAARSATAPALTFLLDSNDNKMPAYLAWYTVASPMGLADD